MRPSEFTSRERTWNDEPNDPEDYLYERLEDMVHVSSSAFLGLTVKCARCHDHKFDPIKQSDYYRMASFFWAGHIGQANLGGPPQSNLAWKAFLAGPTKVRHPNHSTSWSRVTVTGLVPLSSQVF